MNLKKILSAALVALMLTGLVGCQSNGSQEMLPEVEPTVNYGTLVGVNLIEQGDFQDNGSAWHTYFSGGSADVSYSGGKADVKIKNTGVVDYGVQLYYDGFRLFKDGEYTFSFTAVATQDKMIQPRLQLNGGNYHAYVVDDVLVTTEPQTFTLNFTMTDDSDIAPRLAINMGKFKTDTAEAPLTVTISNVSVVLNNSVLGGDGDEAAADPAINLNQLGYAPKDTKIAVFRGEEMDKKFRVVNEAGEVVYTGKITNRNVNVSAMEYDYTGDFSKVTKEGKYFIETDTLGKSYTFEIKDGVYTDALNATVKMLFLQRCGTELSNSFAGDFAHAICHDTKANIFGTEEYIDVSGGWHDAGDYGRYVVPGAKTVADLLLAYKANPDAFSDETGIPESGNGTPDVLDEAKYELDWLFKMQANDGSVYHKVTCAIFPGFVMPEEETDPLIVCPVSTPATADFAAVMAMASETFADIDAGYSANCLAAAKKAYDFLEKSEPISFTNKRPIVTGEYPDGNDADERYWAACALYSATGDAKYHDYIKANCLDECADDLGWADVGAYGNAIYLSMDKSKTDSAVYKLIKTSLISAADRLVEISSADAYGVSVEEYVWGSNMSVENNAMLLLMANNVKPSKAYVKAANEQFNYIFGRNPMSMCYLTGYGTKSAQYPHHRPSMATGAPMPGMVIGGPDQSLEDPFAVAALEGAAPAKCYVDSDQSFSTNETTIYWNSPLVYVMASLGKC